MLQQRVVPCLGSHFFYGSFVSVVNLRLCSLAYEIIGRVIRDEKGLLIV